MRNLGRQSDRPLSNCATLIDANRFAMVRQIPEVVDGIRCNCGCAELEGFYSLLSCYEQGGMAQHCVICQGQAKLAYRMHGDGFSLNAIRKAIDAEFGE